MADKTNATTLTQATEEVAALRVRLNEWRRQYYDEDTPNIEDDVYDRQYARLVELEQAYPQ